MDIKMINNDYENDTDEDDDEDDEDIEYYFDNLIDIVFAELWSTKEEVETWCNL